jgi:hypothetical protein
VQGRLQAGPSAREIPKRNCTKHSPYGYGDGASPGGEPVAAALAESMPRNTSSESETVVSQPWQQVGGGTLQTPKVLNSSKVQLLE